MLLQTKRTICYKCVRCNNFVSAEISAFDVQGGVEVACECGAQDLTLHQENKQYSFGVNCAQCGAKHVRNIDIKAFWANEQFALTCNECGNVVCSVGNSAQQSQFMREMESHFEDDLALTQTVGLMQEMANRGDLVCECGNKKISMKLGYTGIDLLCRKCGAKMFIKARSGEDLRKNRKLKSITLTKNKSKIINIEN